MSHGLERDGFSIVPSVLDLAARNLLIAELGEMAMPRAGRRGLLALPAIAAFARSERIIALVSPHLPAPPRVVRAIYFDKSAAANWLVPWHQDLTLAVERRMETPGFGPWSVKNDIAHVQPPEELLGQMLTIRLHLDDADEENGALRVLPGTHLAGRFSPEQIQHWRGEHPEILCAARAGDALLMRPLLLHASSRSTSGRHRRVLHLEYAGFDLPPPLRWHEAA